MKEYILEGDHPLVLDKMCCDLCKEPFQADDRITLIPKDPVPDDGKTHTVEAVAMHAVCVRWALSAREYTIQFMVLANGISDEHEGEWLVSFEPGPPGSRGVLKTTKKEKEAMCFPSHSAAAEFWRQENGTRADGKPNRPLTVWTVMIEPVGVDLDVEPVDVDGIRSSEGFS